MFESFHQLFFKLISFCNNFKTGCKIFLIREFGPNRFTFLIRFNWTFVNTSHNIIKEDSCFSKISYQRDKIPFLQIGTCMNSKFPYTPRLVRWAVARGRSVPCLTEPPKSRRDADTDGVQPRHDAKEP